MGAANGDFDVQKYEIDKKKLLCQLFFYVRELLRHIYKIGNHKWDIV
jgi:hypothetical protein